MIFNLFPYSPFQHYQITAYCTYSPRARYYQPNLSIWLSVDPMADKYPGVSPYVYCGDNPVRLVDSNGMEITDPPKMLKQATQKLKTTLNNLDVKVRGTDGNYEWEGHSDGANQARDIPEGMKKSVQAIMVVTPVISEINDARTAFVGEDLFGNKATETDRVIACTGLLSSSISKIATIGTKTTAKIATQKATRITSGFSKL